uniref:variable large family protein n=1 Tax=Borreliella garinii TaxID=29519 RepID=UPI001AEF83FF
AAVAKLGELLTEIAKAAQGIAGKIEGDAGEIGEVKTDNSAGKADKDSVNGIAQGMKAIVAAADGDKAGKKASQAQNPIDAAIGTADAAEEFHNDMQKNAKVAAAIVLRGMAKNGKFALQGGEKAGLKAAVEAAVAKLGELLTEIAKAAQGIAGKIEGDAGEIGEVKTDNSAGKADADSVNGIAQGMKAIVEAAKK